MNRFLIGLIQLMRKLRKLHSIFLGTSHLMDLGLISLEMLDNDVTQALLGFFHIGKLLKELNITFLTLIP